MIVNGEMILDVPEYDKTTYPYWVLVKITNSTGGGLVYYFEAASNPFYYIRPELWNDYYNNNENYESISALTEKYIYSRYETVDDSETPYQWAPFETVSTEYSYNHSNVFIGTNYNGDIRSVLASNHDIYYAATMEGYGVPIPGTEIYFKANDVTSPTRVSIGRSLVDGFATQVQRLTGTTEQMNAIQILEKLSTVKAAIKIGDTVLPPIPDGVLEQYPNAVIYKETLTDNSIRYALCVSATPMLLLPKAIAQQVAGKNIDIMYNPYAYRAFYENEAWGDLTVFNNGYVEYEGQMGVAIGEFNGYLYEFIYTNHDIYEVTSVDTSTGQYVLGDIYFSERQNFNGVWLPKVPEDVLAEYPYDVVSIVTNGDTQKYLLAGAVEKFIFDGDVVSSSGKGVIYYTAENDRIWDRYSYAPAGYMYLEKENIIAMVWSNHDIYEYDANGIETGDLYFPPLPAIDTDRVSIGYDLFDSIVEDVQRLSGETEKMNALRAYWKLTTVV